MLNAFCKSTMIAIALLGSGAAAQAEEPRFGLYELERASIGDGGPYYDTSLPNMAGPTGRPAESVEQSATAQTESSEGAAENHNAWNDAGY
jgi:hypothetical protein